MLLFIIIFFAMVIVVSVSAVVGFSAYLKRRPKSLESINQIQFNDVPPYRSLFAPDEEAIRALELEEKSKAHAKELEMMRDLTAKTIEKLHEYRKLWRVSPNKQKTIELLRIASESENSQIFAEIAENVMEIWREKQIAGLTADNLADLLDSHLITLPQQERTAGVLFWLRREIMSLRTESE